MQHNRRRVTAAVGALALATTLVACMPEDEEPSGGETDGGDEVAEGCEDYAVYGDLSGTEVTVYSSIVEPESVDQEDSYVKFEECTGTDIIFEGSQEFEAQLLVRVQAGNTPDIAYIPQPGLLQTIVRDYPDTIVPAPADTEANVDEFFAASWKEYGTVDGTFYAAPLGANMKSFVWYSPSMFAEAGYEVPTTWDEMLALSDQIVADNPDGDAKPWCAGIESGDATGWPATDWIEDIVLRSAGADVYDQWVAHEIPFNDPAILEAFDYADEILRNPDYVDDVASIATIPWGDGGDAILTGECYMHRAANFYQTQLPEGTTVSEDGDAFVFYLPPMTEDNQPVLGGGEFVAAFNDRPEVAAFQTFLSSDTWANEKALATEDGGWVSANSGLDVENLSTDMDKLASSVLGDPETVIRFDASDLMPGAVGSGTFWSEMVNWFANGKSSQDVVDSIESSWP